MNKTLIVQGLTATTAGSAATAAAVDITEKVLAQQPGLETGTATQQLFSTIVTSVVEGKAKYGVLRKRHVQINNTTAALHDANGKIGATRAALTTANFDTLKSDLFEFTLDQSWELAIVIDKKKDPNVIEGDIYRGVGTEMLDLEERKAAAFWQTISDDINGTTKISTKFATFVNTTDGNTANSPVISKEVDISAITTGTGKAEAIVDAMFSAETELKHMGRINSSTAGYPYTRGTDVAIASKVFVVKEDIIPIISKDERFIEVGRGNQMITNGQVGTINNIPVITDAIYDTTCTQDVSLLIRGIYSPVMVVQELADAVAVFDHPTKPTRAILVEGGGAWDVNLTPFINVTRHLTVKQA